MTIIPAYPRPLVSMEWLFSVVCQAGRGTGLDASTDA